MQMGHASQSYDNRMFGTDDLQMIFKIYDLHVIYI
jgi:hypothetical protein